MNSTYPQHQIGIDFKQSLRQELTGYQNNKSGNYSLHQHHYKMIGNNSSKKIHLYELRHQDTVNDKCNVITHQHGRDEVIRIAKEIGNDIGSDA